MEQPRRVAAAWARAAAGWIRRRAIDLVPTAAATVFLVTAYALMLPGSFFDAPYSTLLLDQDGRLLAAGIARDGQWRFPPGGEVPAKFTAAIVEAEDHRFYRHPGVDIFAVARAARDNFSRREVVSGASTITMQVIRLARPGKPRTLGEKVVEAVLALRLELGSSKEEILRHFAAMAPFGGNVVGIEAAAWRYFGVEPGLLTWADCALLAVLPNNPGLVHPGANRETLRLRRDGLLSDLELAGAIDEATLSLALAEPLPGAPHPIPQVAPHLLQRARSEVGEGRRVRTTLDRELQVQVNSILTRHAREWAALELANAAVLVLDVDSGEVRAYAGNLPDPDQTENGYVDMIQGLRSTGSVLKPFLYADLFESGELLPRQLVADVPTRMGSFIPENNTRTFAGAVPARDALARSLNVPAVRLLRTYGLERFYDSLAGLGMTSLSQPPWHYGLTLIIGGAEGSLWDLTGMYAGLARTAAGTGSFYPPRYVNDVDGVVERESGAAPRPESARPGPGAAWLTLDALLEVERPGEEGSWRDYLSGKRIAWKTGTSYGFRDAWALGVTRRYAVGVWVGNATGVGRSELRGATVAAPLLFDVFNVLGPSDWFAAPTGDLTLARVCVRSGYLAGPFCDETTTEVVTLNDAHGASCPYCRLVHLDPGGKYRSTAEAEGMSLVRTENWFVLPPAMEWYYKRSHGDYRSLPPMKPGAGAPLEPSMGIVYPESGSRVYVPVEIDGSPGKTVFHATHRDTSATIYWHLDGEYLGETRELHYMEARPSAGRHVITIVDDNGEELTREFLCLSEK